jgi:hypothetical protein
MTGSVVANSSAGRLRGVLLPGGCVLFAGWAPRCECRSTVPVRRRSSELPAGLRRVRVAQSVGSVWRTNCDNDDQLFVGVAARTDARNRV